MGTLSRLLDTIPGITVAFGIAGAIGGLVSLNVNFLGFAVFGALCGLALGLSSGRWRRIATAVIAGAVGFVAGIALATILGMTIGLSLGPSPYYSYVQASMIGGCAGAVGGLSLALGSGWQHRKWLAALAVAVGFALAALINEEWLLPLLRTDTLSLLPLALWGAFGGVGVGLARRHLD